jgi:hypothetical protein
VGHGGQEPVWNHEFLNYTEMMGAELHICANLGTGTREEAQQWVEYYNSSEDTAMTRLVDRPQREADRGRLPQFRAGIRGSTLRGMNGMCGTGRATRNTGGAPRGVLQPRGRTRGGDSPQNTFVNHANTLNIANMVQLVNVFAPIFANENELFLQIIYYPLQLFANNTRR